MLASDILASPRHARATLTLGSLLTEAGTEQRVSWIALWDAAKWCRAQDGIYVVRWPHGHAPRFNPDTGAAAHATPEDPRELSMKWTAITSRAPTDILYVGMGNPVCSRV